MDFPRGTFPYRAPRWVGSIVNETHRLYLWHLIIKPKQIQIKRPHPDSDTYSDPESEIKELTTYFPTYIVLELVEDKPSTQLSLFIIEKFLSANMPPKSVKATRNNTQIVKVKNEKYAELLLRTTTLHNMKIKAYPHRSLNTSKGMKRSPELTTCTIEEIKLNLKKQLVTDIKRISIKKNNQVVNTNTYILMFDSPKPPTKLKIGYIIAKVDIYIPNPLQHYKYQKFGHYESWCTRRKICKNCAMDGYDHQEATCQWIKMC